MGMPRGLARSSSAHPERKPAAATFVAALFINSLLETTDIDALLTRLRDRSHRHSGGRPHYTRTARGSWKSPFVSSAFAERDDRIRKNLVPRLLQPIRPVNHHKLDLGICSKAKVHSDVAGAQVTGICMHAAKKFASSLLEFDARANAEKILSGLFQAYLQPVVAIVLTGFVQQKAYRPVVVSHHDIDVPVVVDIAEGRSAAYLRKGKRRTCHARGLAKRFSRFVVEQLVDLIERKLAAAQRFLASNRSIGDEDVEESVVVVVKPLCAKSGEGESRLPQAEFCRGIIEISLAIMAIKNAAFLCKVGYQ